jgi:hypothetical protein
MCHVKKSECYLYAWLTRLLQKKLTRLQLTNANSEYKLTLKKMSFSYHVDA